MNERAHTSANDETAGSSDIEEGDAVSIEEVHDATVGDAIALRTTIPRDSSELPIVYVAAGRVTRKPDADPKMELEKTHKETTDSNSPVVRIPVLYFDPEICWSWTNGEFRDKSEQVQNIPSAQPPSTDQPQNPPPCSVIYDQKRRVQLSVLEARGARSGEIYHGLRELGPIVEFIYGEPADPERLVPKYCEQPE